MLIELLFNIIKGALTLLLAPLEAIAGLFPDLGLTELGESLAAAFPAEVGTLLRWVNYYVPLKESILLAVTGLGIWAAVLLYGFAVEVLTRLHVLGGGK